MVVQCCNNIVIRAEQPCWQHCSLGLGAAQHCSQGAAQHCSLGAAQHCSLGAAQQCSLDAAQHCSQLAAQHCSRLLTTCNRLCGYSCVDVLAYDLTRPSSLVGSLWPRWQQVSLLWLQIRSNHRYSSCLVPPLDRVFRLQFVGQGCQMYIKQLKMALNDSTGGSLKEEENKMKVIALRTTSNIHTLIKVVYTCSCGCFLYSYVSNTLCCKHDMNMTCAS